MEVMAQKVDDVNGPSNVGEIKPCESSAQQGEGEVDPSDEKVIDILGTTHDLFCPNCKKCITNTVVLRRKTEPGFLLRCVECFSILIPSGSGLKLFCFGGWQRTTSDEPEKPIDSPPGVTCHKQPASPQQGNTNSNDGGNKSSNGNNRSGPGKEMTSDIPWVVPMPPDESKDPEEELGIGKSIVYGGLLESIASLSVVSSAAGANATTMNIVALAAANMFGGLLVLAHNLRVLKQEPSNERYKEALGGRRHFALQATLAVISYLVFGLLPPVVYGFTFRESDNKDYKLIAVASASLLCILLLGLLKAYTREGNLKDYMKTISYYVGLWVTACGVSYAIGDLLDLLLEKLGLFESSGSIAMRLMKSPWASY